MHGLSFLTHRRSRVTWAAYGEIDIALDPFPHNAGTTTIEALWQGVPVLSLAGRPTVGRFGAAILRAVGLDDWVTDNVEAYVARAVTAAADIDALARLRGGLRPRFAASPLRDAAGLAREIEAAYRALWRRWCEEAPATCGKSMQQATRKAPRRLAEQLLQRDPTVRPHCTSWPDQVQPRGRDDGRRSAAPVTCDRHGRRRPV